MVLMTQTEAVTWATAWIANWNRKDVDAVLSRFAEDAEFISPRAITIVGKIRLSGRSEIAEYWTRALAAIQSLHFELDRVIVDGRSLAIVYTSEINGKPVRACELFLFDETGLVQRGEAMYGAMLS